MQRKSLKKTNLRMILRKSLKKRILRKSLKRKSLKKTILAKELSRLKNLRRKRFRLELRNPKAKAFRLIQDLSLQAGMI